MRRWIGTWLAVGALALAGVLAVARVFVIAGVEERGPAIDEREPAVKEPGTAVEIIAHRGASEDAPENTLAAIELAWAQGADAVEVDARLSRDGRIVLMHDSTTQRTGGRDAKVANQTLAELRTLDVGRRHSAEWAGERVPTLAEALATVPEGRRLFIDLKVGREVVPELVRVLDASRFPPAQIAVIGSSLRTLEAVKRALPAVAAYWIQTVRRHPETGQWLPSLESRIRRAREAGIDGLDFQMAEAIDRAYVAQARQAGLAVFVWNVNTADEARRGYCARVDGITTDRPGWLRELSGLSQPANCR